MNPTILSTLIFALTFALIYVSAMRFMSCRTRKVGGLWFARFGRFQLSWCMCRRR